MLIYKYPLLFSLLANSSKLSMLLYSIPVIIPLGVDKVTLRIPLSNTTCTHMYNHISLFFFSQINN